MDHRYALTVTWTGNTGEGTSSYRGYRRTHTVNAEGPPERLPLELSEARKGLDLVEPDDGEGLAQRFEN